MEIIVCTRIIILIFFNLGKKSLPPGTVYKHTNNFQGLNVQSYFREQRDAMVGNSVLGTKRAVSTISRSILTFCWFDKSL